MVYLLLILTPLFWAGNFVLGRAMHLVLPPVTMAQMRWSLALVLILPFLWPRLHRHWPVICRHWKILLLLSLLSVASFNTFIYIGLTSTGATNTAILQSFVPAIIVLISVLFLHEKITLRQWLGLAISLLGVLTLIFQGDWQVFTRLEVNRGDLWVLAGVVSWALYSVCLRWRPPELDGFTFFGVTVLMGVLALVPFTLWELQSAAPVQWRPEAALTVVYMAIFPSILAYLFWNRGVQELGAPKAGLFSHLMPLYGILLSAVFLGEKIHTSHLLGMVCIFAGIYLAAVADVITKMKKPD